MITKLPKKELVALGARHRLAYLLEQAGYTLGLAAADGDPLVKLLPKGYLPEVNGVLANLKAAQNDRTLLEAESQETTQGHHDAHAGAKVWRRKVVRRATRAKRLGETVPDGLLHISRENSAPALAVHVADMLTLLVANKDIMPGEGIDDLIAEGQGYAASMGAVDAKAELKRMAELPDAVQRFYEQKALLYIALKVINDAGQELHAGDTVNGARYNLSILHRRHPRQQETPTPQPAPAGA